MEAPLWIPSPQTVETANMTAFLKTVNERFSLHLSDYEELYAWSVANIEPFWKTLWDHCDIKAETQGDVILERHSDFKSAAFFPHARLNYAENLLHHATKFPDQDAIVFWGEDKIKRRLSSQDLISQVAKLSAYFKEQGLKPGDRVAGYLPNLPETVIAMLATTSLGGVWASCSPDFGAEAALDRFGQIEPKILLGADGYFYNGKTFSCQEKLDTLAQNLPSVCKTILVSYINDRSSSIFPFVPWDDIQSRTVDAPLTFEPVSFNEPLFITFSSGTTGKPKCIVHRTGGVLLEHLKELKLHCDVKPKDRVFYFTTCGWMMWNWQVSALALGATLMLYEGSPLAPSEDILFDYADTEKITLFGTSAGYLDALRKRNIHPAKTHNLGSIRMMTSTASILSPETFRYVYDHVKKDLCLASISGGTDILGCFAMGNPTGPVWPGQLQTRGLGLAVDVYDNKGRPLDKEHKGELVCTQPFPSMPLKFWNDPTGEKYQNAYFNTYPNIWQHGDYIEITKQNGIIIHGRSDAILNPGGVRIGTGEIYRETAKFSEILESLAVGQNCNQDVRVLLFLKLKEGCQLDDTLKVRLKKIIRENASPRHVPDQIIQVPDVPKTVNGKIIELAIGDIVNGRELKNRGAIANVECLAYFEAFYAKQTAA